MESTKRTQKPWVEMFDGCPREWLEYSLWQIISDVPDSMVGGHHQVYERKGSTDKIYAGDPLRLNTHARSIAAKACAARDRMRAARERNWEPAAPHPLLTPTSGETS